MNLLHKILKIDGPYNYVIGSRYVIKDLHEHDTLHIFIKLLFPNFYINYIITARCTCRNVKTI